MARVSCSYSITATAGEKVTRDSVPALRAPYYSSSSDSSRSTMDLKIKSVEYETTNKTYYVAWECKMYTPGSGRYSCAAVGAAMGGAYSGSHNSGESVKLGPYVIMSKTPSGTYIWNYDDYSSSTVPGSGTYTTTSTSVYLDCRHMMSGGYSSDEDHTRWWQGTNGYRKIGTGTLNITAPSIGNPTISTSYTGTSASRGGSDGTATISASVGAGTNGGNVSYTITCNGKSSSNAALSLTGLKNNTNYTWSATATNSAGKTATSTGTVCLTPQVPSTPTVSTTPDRTSCAFSVSSTYDTNRAYNSTSIQYGTSTSYGSTSSSTTLSNLTPNTTYYYSVTITDKNNGGGYTSTRTSGAKTGSFKTTCNKPSSLSMTRSGGTTTGITVTVAATGDTNAAITNYTLYYKLKSGSSYTSVNLGTVTTKELTGLSVDTDYNFYFTATNAGGTTTSSTYTYSTLLNTPIITTPTVSNLLPFSCTITATGSITPSRTLSYAFSKDNGSTWTAYQSGNSYDWSGLNEETTYQMKVRVKATHTGTNASDTTKDSAALSITTPADQAKIRRKVDGAWVKGKTYYKKDGAWVKAKKIYIKVDGKWKIGTNYDD